MAKYVDINGLSTFKNKQDAYNLAHFASLSGGKVTSEQLPSYVDDVVEGYTTNNDGVVKFYSDSAHTKEIAGETGKIYVDLAATIDGSYRYGGSQFVAIGNSVSTADKAVHDANGNPIAGTYATKTEMASPATTSTTGVVKIGDNVTVAEDGTISVAKGSTSQGGVVKVGSNISVNDGTISLDKSNVTDALGFTPLDSASIGSVSDAEIIAMFES